MSQSVAYWPMGRNMRTCFGGLLAMWTRTKRCQACRITGGAASQVRVHYHLNTTGTIGLTIPPRRASYCGRGRPKQPMQCSISASVLGSNRCSARAPLCGVVSEDGRAIELTPHTPSRKASDRPARQMLNPISLWITARSTLNRLCEAVLAKENICAGGTKCHCGRFRRKWLTRRE